MQRKKFYDIEWLEFDLLNNIPRLKHAVFLRHGGFSEGFYRSLNVGFHPRIGDRIDHVQRNMECIKLQLQHEIPHWHGLVQGTINHGKTVKVVCEVNQEIKDTDGIITAIPGLSLMMTHADCQITLLYDPEHHVAANIHAGWRGSVANIYAEAIKVMQQTFGSQPANLLACISPSLGPEEAEFIHYRTELPEEFWSFQIRPTYFDFWSISEYQLRSAGILPHHIEIARLSTYANPSDFFSYRRDRITGRHATCITLL